MRRPLQQGALSACLFCTLLSFFVHSAPTLAATAQVKLKDPEWQFWFSNTPLFTIAQEAQLKANEHGFMRNLQPLLQAGNYAAAAAQFKQRTLVDDSAALQLLRGQILMQTKDLTGAQQAFHSVIESLPNEARAHRSLAVVYLMQNNHTKARAHLARAIELGSTDAQAYAQLAYINLQSQKYFAAIAGYQQALFLQPDQAQWQQGLAYALTQSGHFSAAQALTDDMLQEAPDKPELWLLRSQIALQQQHPKTGLASLEAALRLGNRDPVNRLLAAQLHLTAGSPTRAVDLLIANLQHWQPSDTATVKTLEQASAWLAAREQWQTLKRLIKAADKNPKLQTLPTLAVPKAQMLAANKKPHQARALLTRALQQDPSQGEALLLLANLQQQEGVVERAVLSLQRAQGLPAYRERALLAHAQLEIDRKAYTAALPLLREAQKLNPERHDLTANIRALQKLSEHHQVL